MEKPVVAIVGRPNVGKSTLFNRIIEERVSIVEDTPGVTRDRIYSKAQWLAHEFMLIDTGGLEIGEVDETMELVRQQAELAMDESDVIVFVLDGRAGITAADEQVARMLYRSKKPVVLAINKLDNPKQMDQAYEFYRLGLGEPFAVSGVHGRGLGDMLDAVCAHFHTESPIDEYEDDVIRMALIGRPNVGKSSMVNALLGEDRVIVSAIAGTTRDAIDTELEREGQKYVIIDTAGIRKRGKVYEKTEKYSVLRATRAIERCDVALVVIDGEQGIVEQDKRIAGMAHDEGRAIIIVVNKWDAVNKDTNTMQRFREHIRSELQFLDYAPILFVSAQKNQRLHYVLPTVNHVAENHALRIPTHVLNDIIADATMMNPPPSDKGKRLKINYGTQVRVKPPTFVLFMNDPELMHFSYERYLDNKIREAFPFEGTPIRIYNRKKSN